MRDGFWGDFNYRVLECFNSSQSYPPRELCANEKEFEYEHSSAKYYAMGVQVHIVLRIIQNLKI